MMKPDEIQRVHAYLSGMVQGVGMRAYVSSLGRKLGVTGFVRNLEDGRVEVLAEGKGEIVEKFFHTIRTGPYSGYVKQVDLEREKPLMEFRQFEIGY